MAASAGEDIRRDLTEKLCVHKKQLQSLWKQIEEYSAERIRRLRK